MRNERSDKAGAGRAEKVPSGQKFLDNIFVLLALGFGVPFLLYTLWGVIEVFHVPPMP